MCQASAPAKDASAKMSDTIHDFAHFKLDPQTATKLVSLCFVCSEEGLGPGKGPLGVGQKARSWELGPKKTKAQIRGLMEGGVAGLIPSRELEVEGGGTTE